MRTHLRWLVPAVLAVVFYVGLMLINQAMYAAYLDNPDLLESLSTPSLIVTVLWFVLPLIMIIMAFRGALRVARDKREARQTASNGGAVLNPTSTASLAGASGGAAALPTPAQNGSAANPGAARRDDEAEDALDRAAWDEATLLATYIRSGEELVAVELADSTLLGMLADDETPVASLHVAYGQFFGEELGDEVDDEDAAEFPPYVTAGLVYTTGDTRLLTEQDVTYGADWSSFTTGQLVVTTDRFLLKPTETAPSEASDSASASASADQDWLSFPYDHLTVIYPAPERWALVLEYDNAAPLLISGRQAPAASVLAVYLTADAEEVADSPALEGINAGEYPINQSGSLT
ncbi:hypothetical protein [Lysinibacter cavernae]|uniref:Putative membrane protein n=1 Tax=Lysinibacter cavernae TaxID=1640652 RepID=A0A7X5R0E5_9MICO|nr:hypothetical protein [Lysinibacter cavernae]NIH53187.1 putative membrane protein [Lysinibacter cavernae]